MADILTLCFHSSLNQIHPHGSAVCHSVNILQTYFSVAYLCLYDLYPSLFLSSYGLLVSLCASVSACFAGDVSGSLSSWTNQHSHERGMIWLHFSLYRYLYIFLRFSWLCLCDGPSQPACVYQLTICCHLCWWSLQAIWR